MKLSTPSQPHKNSVASTEATEETPPVLRWYELEKGIRFALRSNPNPPEFEQSRAHVDSIFNGPGWRWWAFAEGFQSSWAPQPDRCKEGTAPTLELAKEAAEKAVEEMDTR